MSAVAAATTELSDLIVSAQDTFEEVLGWYGLSLRPYTQLRDHCAEEASPMDSISTGSLVARDRASGSRDMALVMRDTGSIHSRDSSAEDADVEVDGDHPVDLTCVAPASSHTAAEQGTISDLLKMQWGSHKKLVGIRFLFPPLDEQMSLLEKAKIWVARHDYKYFVDWTESELEQVDAILRPLSAITRDIYKLHMNRSEYCRNVKLKYCLQSNFPWAQQFRENLAKSPTEGGFRGLCQAKIAAAELWRKYSEHYRSHQARHPHLRNRDVKSAAVVKAPDGDLKTDHEASVSESCYNAVCTDALYIDARCTDSDALSEDCDREVSEKAAAYRDDQRGTLQDMALEKTADRYGANAPIEDETDENGKELQGTKDCSVKRHLESYVEEPKCKKTRNEISRELESRNSSVFGEKTRINFRHPLNSTEFSDVINLTRKGAYDLENRRNTPVRQGLTLTQEASIKTELSQEAEVKSEPRLPRVAAAGSWSYWNMSRLGSLMYQLPMAAAYYTNPMNCFLDSSLSSSALRHQNYPFTPASSDFAASRIAASVDSISSMAPLRKSSKIRGNTNRAELNTEYRRSERGLSFLFPSFSDHNMSLMDKVRITITRHKNNYFLGWDEDALDKLDPLVRPKMMVTTEIYKEYCHRNAMKYDSNLQFAMESAEPWAQEFRKKLSLPASEGGFTSLCEVKLEAGRLWREYSGKYRMLTMDLNSNAVPTRSLTVGGTSLNGRSSKGLFRKITRKPRQKDQHQMLHRNVYSLPKDSDSSLQQNDDIGSQQNGHTRHRYGHGHFPEGLGCSSPLVGSFSEGASPRADSCGELPVGEVCRRVSRSLDNSPSVGGSSDRSTSNASMAGDAACSPVTEQSPHMASTPHRMEPADDFLFAPLPRQMSVADQLFIWLKRHRNNYFLEFPEESLSALDTYLRPQVVVTRDVFQRHIPESMVDVLGKIEWMMSSSDDWAVRFCDRICKPPKDGGFSTFEEALTEAVVLWHVNKNGEIYEKVPIEPDSAVADSSEDKCFTPLRQSNKDEELSSKRSVGVESELAAACSDSSKCGVLNGDANENKSEGGDKPRSLSANRSVARLKDGFTINCDSLNPSSEFNHQSMIQLLWNLRQTLNAVCRDSPVESWEQRLVPYYPALKRAVGSSYTVPVSNTSCMIDLILAVLHQRIEESFPVS